MADGSMGHFFPFEKTGEFLYAVRNRRGREKAGCERLQRLVNILGEKMKDLLAQYVFHALYALAHIDSKDLCLGAEMLGVEMLYRGRLGEISPQNLAWLASASSCISFRSREYDCVELCKNLLGEFSDRFSDFLPSEVGSMVRSLIFASTRKTVDGKTHQRMEQVLQDIDNRFAPDISALEPKGIAQVASSFRRFGYKAQRISFRDTLFDHMDSFEPHQIAAVFRTVSRFGTADEALLRKLLTRIDVDVNCWDAKVMVDILFILCWAEVAIFPSCRDVAVVKKEIIRRMSKSQNSFSSAQCARIIYASVRLRMNGLQAIGGLIDNMIDDFEHLTMTEMGQFVFGVSQLTENWKYMADVRKAINSTDIKEKGLGLHQGILVCRGFVAMRLVDQPWLEEVVLFSRGHLATLMVESRRHMGVILCCLSQLNFPCSGLFEEVMAWLEEHESLVQEIGWSVEVIKILWASVVQDVFPLKILQQLRGRELSSINEMPPVERIRLHQLLVIAQQQYKVDIMQTPTLAAQQEAEKQTQLAIPSAYLRPSIEFITQYFPSGHVRAVYTAGEKILCALAVLKNKDGASVEWPSNDSDELSVADIARLQSCGHQPVAALLLGLSCYNSSQRILGLWEMRRKTLEACGWQVLMIAISEFSKATDKENFVCSELERMGVKVHQ